MAEPTKVILCLGSNVEPRRQRIDNALATLAASATIVAATDAVESDDITGRGEPYLNMAVRCVTDLSLAEFKAIICKAERDGGRSAERTLCGIVDIDIDLIIWGDRVISPADLERPYFTPLYRCITVY